MGHIAIVPCLWRYNDHASHVVHLSKIVNTIELWLALKWDLRLLIVAFIYLHVG